MYLVGAADPPVIVGRSELLSEIGTRLATTGRVLLTGSVGMGKTAVLAAVAASATAEEYLLRVAARAADATGAYTLLADLLEAFPPELLTALPHPRRAAVDAVLRRVEPPAGSEPDRLALRFALLDLLRRASPVLLIVDDAQWIDPDSADVLGYALARLGTTVRVAVAERAGGPGVGRSLCPQPGVELTVPPLTADDVAAFLEAHGLPCRLVGPVHAASGGHPDLMLEIGRALAAGAGAVRPAEGQPLPDRLRELVHDRLAGLPRSVRRTLVPLALARCPSVALLRRIGRPDAAEELAVAEAAGLVTVAETGQVAFTAGVLASAVAAEATFAERAAWHTALAGQVADPVDQVRHRALGTEDPDEDLATGLETAGAAASDRGERARAAELYLLAAGRTPPQDAAAVERRLLVAAEEAGTAGRTDLVGRASGQLLERSASPEVRVRARLAIIDAAGQALDEHDETFARAAADAAEDPALLAAVHLRLAWKANLSDGSPQRARAEAQRAAELAARGADPVVEAMALTMQARVERILGIVDSARTLQRALALGAPETQMELRNSPSYLAARYAVYDDRLADARRALLTLLPTAEHSGAEDLIEVLRSLAEVESRSGRCAHALDHARRAVAVTEEAGLSPGPSWYTMALAEAAGGSFSRATGYAERGARASAQEHDVVFRSRNLHVLGQVRLVIGDTTGAVTDLRRVRELETAAYVLDPALLRWHADLALALVTGGEPDEGYAVIAGTRLTALALGRHGVLATLDRAEAVYRSTLGDSTGAVELLELAIGRFTQLAMPVELGRTMLILGQVERRRRRRGAARTAMTDARTLFEDVGARPWSELAATALERLESAGGEPRPTTLRPLTETETRIAELVGHGATNREVAATLFLSVKTVEATLTRIYRKLDVRSRTQLGTLLRSA